MPDDKSTEATPPAEKSEPEDGWNKLTGLVENTVRKVVGEELGKWGSKKTSTDSSASSTDGTTPPEKKQGFLEKLISG